MVINKDELIKSPLNYTGGKFKLLPQILPLFPDNINTFIDLFAGGLDVSLNVKANKIIANDIVSEVMELMEYLINNKYEDIIKEVTSIIREYNLSETNINGYAYYNTTSNKGVGNFNKKSYLKLRDKYNKGRRNPMFFYTMIIFSFNNMIRFNNEHNFNVAVNKRDFNNNLRMKLKKMLDKNIKNIRFFNRSFEDLKIDTLNSNDFVYADPPYLITTANYNENDGWNEELEYKLLDKLNYLNKKGIKFALSNVLEHKGKSNDILKEWSKTYNIHYLNHNYGNCNYQTKDKSKNSSVEVLITNY